MRFTCNSFAVALLLAAALHADDRRCATCHPKEVAGYAKSAMAASLSVAANQPAGAFDHALSSTKFTIRATPEGQIQSYQRGSESSEHRVAYVIGSGAHAFGYLVQIGDHLFQSPLSYYSSLRTWDVAPGYEESKQPDFSRPVTPECLLCHAEQPRPIPDTVNRYETPPVVGASISCERCHGTVEAHEKNPVPGSIVNPAKLQAAARDSVCEQCHLSGEVRIPNPGKSIADFQPGQRLEDSYSVYVAAHPPGTTVKSSWRSVYVPEVVGVSCGAGRVTIHMTNLFSRQLTSGTAVSPAMRLRLRSHMPRRAAIAFRVTCRVWTRATGDIPRLRITASPATPKPPPQNQNRMD